MRTESYDWACVVCKGRCSVIVVEVPWFDCRELKGTNVYVYGEVNYLWWIVYTLDWYGSAEGGRERSVEEEDKQEKQKGEEEKEHTSALSLQSWKRGSPLQHMLDQELEEEASACNSYRDGMGLEIWCVEWLWIQIFSGQSSMCTWSHHQNTFKKLFYPDPNCIA